MKVLTVLALGSLATAYPGMKAADGKKRDYSGIFKALIERAGERLIVERQGPPAETVTKIGNLQDAGTGGSATNDQIMNCFNSPNGAACLATTTYVPPKKDTYECAADTCCIWSYIKDDLVPVFQESDGTCSDVARNAIRFGFHDAAAWNTAQTHGGADGSLLLSPDETSRTENSGLDKAKVALLPIYLKYKHYGISAADLVQFAHNVAVVVCPLGPRSLTFVGRPEWTPMDGENPTGMLPDARAAPDVNLDLFANKTIGTVDLVSLLGAHTTAKQFFFDTSKAGMPLDSTPGVWDVAFYSEVLAGQPKCGVFRLPSDDSFGNFSESAGGFNAFNVGFPDDAGSGQLLWNGLYSRGYLRLSLLGVQNIQGLTDCSKVLPLGTTSFDKPPSAFATCAASSSVSSSVATKSASSSVSSSVATSVVSSSASTSVSSGVASSVASQSGASQSVAQSSASKSATFSASQSAAQSTTTSASTSTAQSSKSLGLFTATGIAPPPVSTVSASVSSGVVVYSSTSWSSYATTVTQTITYSTTTSCQTSTLTTSSPVVQYYTSSSGAPTTSSAAASSAATILGTSTGTLTHTSTIALGSGSYSTSTWQVPVTSIVWSAPGQAPVSTTSSANSPAYTGAANKAQVAGAGLVALIGLAAAL